MLHDETLVEVVNFSGINTGYTIPELNVIRSFVPWEKKKIPAKELRALFYIPGGEELIRNYLSVRNEELLVELGIEPETEYYWNEEDIKDMLLNGSVDRLADCLEFAPNGISNTVKKLAVDLEINDMNKRQVIQDFTGFNVTKAIEFTKITQEAEAEAGAIVTPKVSKRRVPVE